MPHPTPTLTTPSHPMHSLHGQVFAQPMYETIEVRVFG